MRHGLELVATIAALLATAAPVAARGSDPQCKKIREAVQAGRTLDQVMVEFEVDAAHVMKCLQSRGPKRAAPKPAHAPKAKAAAKKKSAPPSGPQPATESHTSSNRASTVTKGKK